MVMEHDNYGLIATQPSGMIGEELEHQIQAYPKTQELRYIKMNGLK